ncbi:hypothetical protein [Azospirillum halopraeferens]|uniref:hypothetical protein n=1 Tax=Azospirillum halopraeferens TaxID=34010 RepID=UPI0004003738|nr:hypothetical protein [Azospirillum halopraeferens]
MMTFVFVAAVTLATLGIGLRQAFRRLAATEETVARAAVRKKAQVDRIRRAARTTLDLAREIRETKRRRRSVELACEELEERLAATNAAERRLYVLDDRRTPSDLSWIVRIANLEYGTRVNPGLEKTALKAWKNGRRFVVWALDERKAREKALARYPEHKGFYIQGVARHEG